MNTKKKTETMTAIRITAIIIVLLLMFIQKVDGLTCLKCDGVPQPRYCNKVVDCFELESCGVEKVLNEFGEHVFNLGCFSKQVCSNATVELNPSLTKSCIECCESGSLCNSQGCGEPGYPMDIGPICYNCPIHTGAGRCHDIEFCSLGEACSIVGKNLFSNVVYASKCVSNHACESANATHVAIIGKRDIAMAKRTHELHVCDACCSRDLCNRDCETALGINNHCMPNPCQNGQCENVGGKFVCRCPSGYTGKLCKVTDHCTPNPCQNGNCENVGGGFVCRCPSGYTGKLCETTDNCIPNPCQNGNCENVGGGFVCRCPSGYTGKLCETTDHCIPNPCQNGNCENVGGGFVCRCPSGYTGKLCETTDNCIPNPCQNGNCENVGGGFVCRCPSGYTGKLCETTDHCTPNPCQNGNCEIQGEYVTCTCFPGYSGIVCEVDLDDCAWYSCGTYGTCVDAVNNYTCACQEGYEGRRCSIKSSMTDCSDLASYTNYNTDGIYNITTWKSHQDLQVYCDMTTGGWTVFQNRYDGSVNFTRNFQQYVDGFGDLSGEFWLGLEYIYELTTQGQTELRIEFATVDGKKAYETFRNFSLSAGSNYTLHLSTASGTAGSDGLSYHNNMVFSTFDHDKTRAKCASRDDGGWWYNYCSYSNLNGRYCYPTDTGCTIYYNVTEFPRINTTRMMFRRIY